MTTIEAREKISLELIQAFREWLDDYKNLPDREFSKKYAFGKGFTEKKYNFACLKVFMEYEFCGRWLQGWVKEGYPREIIWKLHREKFLSLDEYSNWEARHTGRTSFYYVSQRVAREIWKQYK